MKRRGIFIAWLTLIASINATDFHIAAIDPTSAGQIGVNPVAPVTTVITRTDFVSINTQAPGDPKSNIGSIGVNTEYLTEDAGTTKWIGPNTAYLTELIQTATVTGVETTITKTPSIQIVGPVDDDGLPTGAFDLLITPMLVGQIQDLADTFCKNKSTCSTDFPPRVEALLKGAGNILTKRGVGWVVVGLIGIVAAQPKVQEFYAYGVAGYWKIAFAGDPIPNIIHIDIPEDAAPSPTVVMPTNFVITLEVMPTTGVDTDVDENPNDDDDDDGCWKYVGVDTEPTDSNDLDDEFSDSDEEATPVKRSVAGRISLGQKFSAQLPSLTKRVAGRIKYINKIGKCKPTPTPNVIVKSEIHPGPRSAMLPFNLQGTGDSIGVNGLDPNLYWYVPLQGAEDVGKVCVIASLTKKGKRDPANPSVLEDNFPLPYNQLTTETSLNVDHIFETSTLQAFFTSIFTDENDPRCKPFIDIFDKMDTGLQGGNKPRFYSLWSQQSNPLPGNWAFAGVDERINTFKGTLLNAKLDGWPKLKNVDGPGADDHFDKLFQTWNNVGLSMDFLNDPNVAAYFSQRNAKVYAAFRDFDEIQKCEKDPSDTTTSIAWAEEFKKYMGNLLMANQGLLMAKIADLDDKIAAQDARLKNPKTGLPNKYGKALMSLRATYPASHFVYNRDALLKFPEESVGIRDVTTTDTCPKPTSSPVAPPCVIRTIVDCVYNYEDRPDLVGSACPPVPPLPTSCGGSGAAATSTPAPSAEPRATSTPQPPVLGSQGCYAKESHEDILGKQVSNDADGICSKIWNDGGKVTMDANTVAKTFNPTSWYLGVNNYWYGVGWIIGCQTTAATQLVFDPLGDGNQDHVCPKLLSNSWANCNNGGTGGWIDAGCLRYTFKASSNKLTDNWDQVVKLS